MKEHKQPISHQKTQPSNGSPAKYYHRDEEKQIANQTWTNERNPEEDRTFEKHKMQ